MEKNQGKARVIRTTEKRSPRGIRRLGQALIALAQAEADAQAQAEAEAANRQSKPRNTDHPSGDASRPTGDAA